MSYQILKFIHILSATIMIGTGIGSAFYMFMTYKNSNFSTIKDVLKKVILADLLFTTPSVITQLITGLLLSDILDLSETKWFTLTLSTTVVMLILWLFAVFIQYKLKQISVNSSKISALYKKLMKYWVYLGVPSFFLSIYLYYLMIFKPFI